MSKMANEESRDYEYTATVEHNMSSNVYSVKIQTVREFAQLLYSIKTSVEVNSAQNDVVITIQGISIVNDVFHYTSQAQGDIEFTVDSQKFSLTFIRGNKHASFNIDTQSPESLVSFCGTGNPFIAVNFE